MRYSLLFYWERWRMCWDRIEWFHLRLLMNRKHESGLTMRVLSMMRWEVETGFPESRSVFERVALKEQSLYSEYLEEMILCLEQREQLYWNTYKERLITWIVAERKCI